jgi:arylformamidase
VAMEPKKLIDITVPLHEGMEKASPSFEGFRLKWDVRIERGDGRNRSTISMESHVGTHVDAPLHFIRNGKSIDEMPIENLFGSAEVIRISHPDAVTADLLERQHRGASIVLFKFGKERLSRKWRYFSGDGVEALVARGVRVVGTDNYDIDSVDTQWEIHHLILGNEILVIETLNLEGVAEGLYELMCAPLHIKGAEAAPARAFLVKR